MSRALLPQQRAFIEKYALTYNAHQAYKEVYGTDSNDKPYKILQKPEAQEYLKQLQSEAVSRWGDVAQLLQQELLQDVMERDENGRHNGNWQKSVELLGKQLGLYTNNVKVESSGFNIVITGEDENND